MRFLRLPLLLVLLVVLGSCRDDEGWITVQNDTPANIVSVTIDPCGVAPTGTDRLAGGRIPPGRREAFRVSFGCYDVLVRAEGGLEGRWQVGVNADEPNVTVFARPQQP
jgi:hypothetical protein